jgi:hypothetical protein
MAQAEGTSARRSRSQGKSSARSRGSSSKSTKRAANKTPQSANRQSAQSASKTNKPSPVSVSAVENTAKEAGRTAKDAGKTVGRAASKAKVPLLAGGAALAGAAGGIALGAHQARRHKGIAGRIKRDDVAKAAKRVGSFGVQMGQLATELQHAREDSNGHTRSPIEVVLEGLTARRSRA